MAAAIDTRWHTQILDAGAAALDGPGAVVVRFTRNGAEAVSRVYNADDYLTTTELRRVAHRRSTQLRNQDHSGWNYYVVTRGESGRLVVWYYMHGILCERDGDSK